MWAHNLRLARAAEFVGDLGAAPPQTPHPQAGDQPLELPKEINIATAPADLPAPMSEQPQPPATPPEVQPVPAREVPAAPAREVPTAAPSALVDLPLPAYKSCPSGQRASLQNIRTVGGGCYAVYRLPGGSCRQCPQRAGCTSSINPSYRREFSVPLPATAFADRAAILAEVRAAASTEASPPSAPAESREATSSPPAPASAPSTATARWTPPTPTTAGPALPAPPSLRPSLLTHTWQDHHRRFAIEVRIVDPPPPQRSRPWLAATDAQRQQRRGTWTQRDQLNEVRGSVRVTRFPLASDQDGLIGGKAA